MEWKAYDPQWLVVLARSERPDLPWLADAFFRCTRCREKSEVYLSFVDADRANQPGADWQFRESLFLRDPVEGLLLIDLLKDGRVGGVEFYDRLFSRPEE